MFSYIKGKQEDIERGKSKGKQRIQRELGKSKKVKLVSGENY